MDFTDVTTKQQDANFEVLSPVPRDLWESVTRSCPTLSRQRPSPGVTPCWRAAPTRTSACCMSSPPDGRCCCRWSSAAGAPRWSPRPRHGRAAGASAARSPAAAPSRRPRPPPCSTTWSAATSSAPKSTSAISPIPPGCTPPAGTGSHRPVLCPGPHRRLRHCSAEKVQKRHSDGSAKG